jgi:hypothetical protein
MLTSSSPATVQLLNVSTPMKPRTTVPFVALGMKVSMMVPASLR